MSTRRTVTRTSSVRLFAAGGSLETQPTHQDIEDFRLALPDDLVTALTDRHFILRKPLLHQGLLIPEVADHYCRAVGELPGAEDVRSAAQALLVNPDGEGLLVLKTGTLLDACELSQALTLLTAVLSMVSRPLRAFDQWPLWKPLGTNLSIDPMRATGTGYNPLHLDIVNSTRPPDHSVLLCVRPDPLGAGHSLVSQVRRALARLEHDDVVLLRDPVYKDGVFFALSGVGEEWNPFPIVDDLPPGDGFVRFTGKMLTGADPHAPHTVAARRLETELVAAQRRFRLERGDLVVVNQHLTCHGREALAAGQDDVPENERRLLMQMFLRDCDTAGKGRSVR